MGKQVHVIGAATAGLVAAKRIAQRGIAVNVYDQKAVLGHPVRASGILSISGLSTLGVNYSSAITNTLYGANIHSATKTMRILSSKPIAHVLDRKRLNEVCRDEAEVAGASVTVGKRVSGAELERMRACGIVVGADGAVSTVAKHFSLGEINRMLITYKAEFNIQVPDRNVVDLFFDNGKYPGLFAWLCPNAQDLLEVGVGIDSTSGNAKRTFEAFLREPQISSIIGKNRPVSEGASVIPMTLRKRFVDGKRRIMLIGDAAGQVKPTTGGGIVFGGNGAIIAADTIHDYYEGTAKLDEYQKRFLGAYGLDLKLHSMINRLYSSLGTRGVGTMIEACNMLGVDKFLSIYGDMDRPSLV
ncbi:MAG: NAD(P)/FAD-dependent oxidoreductase, partial [Candidatus Micrarchaeota archaeon]|nr:NAD(P)/FAD-dependent oxidoreductase [Candidatus Micrarchaeota archaeon]